jgi:hypothetical protein
MSERMILGRPGKDSPRKREAFRQAKALIESGVRCDDCRELHTDRLAVAFVLGSPEKDDKGVLNFPVSFLCRMHADMFMISRAPRRQTIIDAPKSGTQSVITDAEIKVN